MNDTTAVEKREIDIRFIPIACAAPLAYAFIGGFFERNGLSVNLRAAPGWSGIKELLVFGRVDAVHMLTPMPLSSSLGADGKPADVRLCAIQNVNGQALVVAARHAGLRHMNEMRGFAFGVPYLFSMQYYLLCEHLRRHGIDPLRDVTIEEVVPPLMPYYMKKRRLDAVMSPEPFGELIAGQGDGFIHTLSRDIWAGHPCCALATTGRFAEAYPATYRAMLRSVIEAEWALHRAGHDERALIAGEIAAVCRWDSAVVAAMRRVLAGRVVDRSGQERVVPDRIDFIPFPFRDHGTWIVAQMQRLGQLPRGIDPRRAAEAVFLEEPALELAHAVGFSAPPPSLLAATPEAPTDEDAVSGGRLAGGAFNGRRYDLPAPAAERLSAILAWLAGVAGNEPIAPIEITSCDEMGWLERMLAEVVLNARFVREALDERIELEEQARRQETIIAAQRELIRALSTPIVPVLDRVLVLPLVGELDGERAQRIMASLLEEASRAAAEIILLDVTGVPSMDAAALDQLLRVTRAASLLGAECVLVGISADVARDLAAYDGERALPVTRADLRSGIEYALRRTGRRIAPR